MTVKNIAFEIKKFLKMPLRVTRNLIRDLRAVKYLEDEQKLERKGNKIRVGIICQIISIWGKYRLIYEALQKDGRFEPILLCVPSQIVNQKLVGVDGADNDTYDYFIKNGYKDAVNTRSEGEWLDLRELDLDYVFYPRPYNSVMPKEYHSAAVSRYSRVCSVMYGMAVTKELGKSCINKDFYRNCFLFFADTQFTRRHNMHKNKRGHKKGLQYTAYCANAALGQMFDEKEKEAPAWDFAGDKLRVLWTPRWTTVKRDGGSNFFTYKNLLFDYAEKNDDVAFLFRPHPLALANFVKTGEMTQAEADEFRKKCDEMSNVALDGAGRYEATFWQSDVLLTDLSSIIMEYFMTGKPIIFCKNNMKLHIIDEVQEVIDACYTVETEAELIACIEQLKRGDDPLKERRKEVFDKLFADEIFKSVDRVVETLAEKSSRGK